jgi:aminobenzoyl-glutamate utilization protein B
MRPSSCKLLLSVSSLFAMTYATAAADEKFTAAQQTAIDDVDARGKEIAEVNKALWNWAEVGLQEHKSSALLIDKLQSAGFSVKKNLSGMPTAFVASYGSGKPVIGILAEYDALPGVSQKVSPTREPVTPGGAGHACGHSGLGSGALGAAIAVKAAIEKHKLKGTIRLYGTPAEETVIGKVYMALDGQFDDLDICLHWHPSSANGAWSGSSKAVVSAKFTFAGTASHASVSPEAGRSALDAVELMNIGANYMREHLKEDARLHYVVTDGGGQPNVVPAQATVWYFVRANEHKDVEYNFAWLKDIADGAAKMTRTKVSVQIDTDCHEIVPNQPLSQLIHKHMTAIGPPKFTDDEKAFARRLQEPLTREFGTVFPEALKEEVDRLVTTPPPNKGSTDVGDVSWRVPTGGLHTACMAAGSPGHSWQNVAAIGSSIGEKGILYAAKSLAVTAIDLLENPEHIAAARADWEERLKGRKYITLIPEGQKAPAAIR